MAKDTSFERAAEKAVAEMRRWKYAGPDYTEGIAHTNLWEVPIRPRDFTDAEREVFLAAFPQFDDWFEFS